MATCPSCGFKPEASSVTDSQLAWNVDVLNVLRSGDVLSSAATSLIPGRVAVLEARHRAMHDNLARLEELIAQKRQDIASMRIEIEQIKSLAAPIHSIPHTILLHIFSLVDVHSYPALQPQRPPCSFGHVCKFWRTLSRSSPSLWSRVDIGKSMFAYNAKFSIHVLKQHLVLSNPRPLNVAFHSGERSSKSIKGLLGALSGNSTRLQELDIIAGKSAIKCLFDMLSKADLRLLKHLRVGVFDSKFPALKAYDIVFHESLRSLDMELPFSAFKSVQAQWQTLTSFVGPFSGAGSFYRFIVAAENLARLRISCIGDEDDSQTRSRTVFVHENVNHLTVGPSCSMSLALDNISFPYLKELIINEYLRSRGTCPRHPRRNYDTVLSGLLNRSRCNLNTFANTVAAFVYLEPQTMTSIWRMSNLISLQLDLSNEIYTLPSEVSALLDSLTVTPSQQPLPGLRELEIMCGMTVDHLFTNSKLYDLVASRWNVTGSVSRLSKLTLGNYIELDEPSITYYETSTLASFLLNLKDQGLDVVWTMATKTRTQDVLADAQKAVESYL